MERTLCRLTEVKGSKSLGAMGLQMANDSKYTAKLDKK